MKNSSNDMVRVHVDGKWGYGSRSRLNDIQYEYDYIYPFKGSDITKTKINNKYGIINTNGTKVEPCRYSTISISNKGVDGKHVVILEDSIGNYTKYKYDTVKEKLVYYNDENYISAKIRPETNTSIPIKDIDNIIKYGETLKPFPPYPYSGMASTLTRMRNSYANAILSNIDLPKALDNFNISKKPITTASQGQSIRYTNSKGISIVENECKYGIINKKGVESISCIYDDITPHPTGYSICELNNLYGVINKKGKMIVSCVYDDMPTINKDRFIIVKLKGRYGLMNKKGTELLPCKFECISISDKDENGKFEISVQLIKDYSIESTYMSDGIKLLHDDGIGAVRFPHMDKNINELAHLHLNAIDRLNGGIIKTIDDRIYDSLKIPDIYVDTIGSTDGISTTNVVSKVNETLSASVKILKDRYLEFSKDKRIFTNNENGLRVVEKDGRYGVVDSKGDFIAQCIYDAISEFDENGFAILILNSRYGIIDLNGNVIAACKYDNVYRCDKYIGIELGGKCGAIGVTGSVLLPCMYDEIPTINKDDILNVKLNGKYGLINKKGEHLALPIYDTISEFDKDGIAKTSIAGKYGLINKKGEVLVSCKYDTVTRNENGVSIVMCEGTYDVIMDKQQHAKCVYDHVFISRKYNYIVTELENRYGIIANTGSVIAPCIYDEVPTINKDDMIDVKLNGKYGLINKGGQIIVVCKYDAICKFDDHGFAKVSFNNKYGIIDKEGKDVVSCKYDSIGNFDRSGIAVAYDKDYDLTTLIDIRNGKVRLERAYKAMYPNSDRVLYKEECDNNTPSSHIGK